MTDKLKQLTGKNKPEYTSMAKHLLDDCDVDLFRELVENDSFLFDFVKQNVADRISNAVNESNYKSFLKFLKYYSPFYEEVIISVLVKFANEDLTDFMLEKFENGTIEEKTYCAKYFAYIQDPLSKPLLEKFAYDEDEFLSQNCAYTLSMQNDIDSYNNALQKLNSDDDFEKLSAVKFLIAYGKKEALDEIIKTLKTSTLAENIAGQIPYLISLFELLDKNYIDGLIVLNHILNGLGEILPISMIFDFELFDVLEKLIGEFKNSKTAVVLLNAIEKFDLLTENDEYLFDEDKNTKNEVNDIKRVLKNVDKKELEKLINLELDEDSPFVFTALDYSKDTLAIRELLKSNNQTVILKTAEVLKKLGSFDETARTVALVKVSDINIKSIIRAL